MADRIITRDLDELLTFEGKRVVPVSSESGDYFEWEITLSGQPYCIVREGDDWTLLRSDRETNWTECADDVDAFLRTHRLILAA